MFKNNDNSWWRVNPPDDGSNRPVVYDPSRAEDVKFRTNRIPGSKLAGMTLRAVYDTARGYRHHMVNRPFPTLGSTGGAGIIAAMMSYITPTAISLIQSPHTPTDGKIAFSALLIGTAGMACVFVGRYWKTGDHLRHNSFINHETGHSGSNEFREGLLKEGREGLLVKSALSTFGEGYIYSGPELVKHLKFEGEEFVRKDVKPFKKKGEMMRMVAIVSALKQHDEYVRKTFSDALHPESMNQINDHLQKKFMGDVGVFKQLSAGLDGDEPDTGPR